MHADRLALSLRRSLPALLLALGLGVASASAHNNPTFREELLLTIEVAAEPLPSGNPAYSEAFALELPPRTIELLWRIDAPDADGITFSVAQDGEIVAEGLGHGSTSRLLRGEGLVITDVSGADGPFTLEIHANVIDRS